MDEAQPYEFLLEAMREVDAMLPGTPPIAPRRLTPGEMAYAAPGRFLSVDLPPAKLHLVKGGR